MAIGFGQVEVEATPAIGERGLGQCPLEAAESQLAVTGGQRAPTDPLQGLRRVEVTGRLGGQEVCSDGGGVGTVGPEEPGGG